MKQPCEICRGAGFVRLPIYQTVRVTAPLSASATMEETSRTYP